MKRNRELKALAAITLVLLVSLVEAEGREPKAGVELFNGKDLAGWINVNGAEETWRVRDGVLICTGSPRCFLRTEKMYENYVLEVQWRHVSAGGNSGIFFHTDALPQIGAPYPRGIEAQLLDGDHGSLFGIRDASLEPLTNPARKGKTAMARPLENRCFAAGKWNTYVLTCQSGSIELAVNGSIVSRATRTSLVKGHIGLQAEHSEVHFRKIRIRTLPSSNPKPEQIAEPDEGFRSIFDGLSFNHWNHRPGHVGHWTARDGEIHYDGQAESKKRTDKDLWTEKAFGDFALIADWRLPAKPAMKQHPIVLPNGDFVFDDRGKRKTFEHIDAGDSGIYLRGSSKRQLNIWSQKLGSGEINGYRTDRKLSAAIRKACIPSTNADRPFGQWNRFVISVVGERVSVTLNGETVIDNAHLPQMPRQGPIGLQHHGDPVQFRNLLIKRLTRQQD